MKADGAYLAEVLRAEAELLSSHDSHQVIADRLGISADVVRIYCDHLVQRSRLGRCAHVQQGDGKSEQQPSWDPFAQQDQRHDQGPQFLRRSNSRTGTSSPMASSRAGLHSRLIRSTVRLRDNRRISTRHSIRGNPTGSHTRRRRHSSTTPSCIASACATRPGNGRPTPGRGRSRIAASRPAAWCTPGSPR